MKGLAQPYGIDVSGDPGERIDQFIVNPDETCADAIQRLMTNYGMIVTSDPEGNLTVRDGGNYTNPGIAVKEGVNIDYAVGVMDDSKRFSAIKAIGQNILSPNFSIEREGAGKRIRRNDFIMSGEVKQSDCVLSAERIRDYTNGSAIAVDVKITTLDYYPAGTVATVEIPSMGINSDMLIETVILAFDENQASVNFNMVSPEKYGGDQMTAGFLK